MGLPINSIEALRQLPTMVRAEDLAPLSYQCSVVPCALPRQGLVEICGALGSGKTELILQFLKEFPELRVAWVEDEFSINPAIFPRWGIPLSRLAFAQGDADFPARRVVLELLASSYHQVIVVGATRLFETDIKRMALLAKKRGTLILLLRHTDEGAFAPKALPVRCKLLVSRSESAKATISVMRGEGV